MHMIGQEKAAPVFLTGLDKFEVGPIGIWTLPVGPSDYSKPPATTIVDTEGKVTEIKIQHGNSIDFMQVFYDGHTGNPVGDWLDTRDTAYLPAQTNPPTVEQFCGLRMRFAQGLMCEITALYASGEGADYGNASGWQGTVFEASVGRGYEMVGASYSPGVGPSYTTGVQVITLKFNHRSLMVQT